MKTEADTAGPSIFLLGSTGQIGWELQRTLAPVGRIDAPERERLDATDLDALDSYVRELRPDLIVNAAAYTDVDGAEDDERLAARLNVKLPERLAELSAELGAPLVHYSTDYVFDGEKDGPYRESDPTNPLGVYGETKRDGEVAIDEAAERWFVFRTSWVYGLRRSNFLKTMLRLAGEHDELTVVDDEIGAPTWCRQLAEATAHALVVWREREWSSDLSGLYHMTASGSTSWCGFAKAIFEAWADRLDDVPSVEPIPSSEYPTPAPRPTNSRMSNKKLYDTFGLKLPNWKRSLETVRADAASRS